MPYPTCAVHRAPRCCPHAVRCTDSGTSVCTTADAPPCLREKDRTPGLSALRRRRWGFQCTKRAGQGRRPSDGGGSRASTRRESFVCAAKCIDPAVQYGSSRQHSGNVFEPHGSLAGALRIQRCACAVDTACRVSGVGTKRPGG